MDLKNISEDVANKISISKLIVGLGLEHIVENSYIVIATFQLNKNKKRYYASGESIESVYIKASKYFKNPEFKGFIYHIQENCGVPILSNQVLNIKHWNKKSKS